MPVHGAALHKRVEKQLREELAGWGLPMDEYTFEIGGYYPDDPEVVMHATFTRSSNESKIQIANIYTDKETGDVLQSDMPTLS
jgi:hypothetical protein